MNRVSGEARVLSRLRSVGLVRNRGDKIASSRSESSWFRRCAVSCPPCCSHSSPRSPSPARSSPSPAPSPKGTTPTCVGGCSGRSAAGGRRRWPESPVTRRPSFSAPPTAASGRPPTPASPGVRSSSASGLRRSAPWRSLRAIRTYCGSAPDRCTNAGTSSLARACTARSTGAQPGPRRAWPTAATSARSGSIRETLMSPSSPRSGISSARG